MPDAEIGHVMNRWKRRRAMVLSSALLLASCPIAMADNEAGNQPHVTSSEWGQFYAKSVPAENYGLKGTTKVYQVQPEQDQLLYTYDWYASTLYVEGFAGLETVYVVQMGPWPRGHEALEDHLAIAFYKNERLVRSYSTLDIAGDPQNVQWTVSHYQVFGKRHGFRRPFGNQLVFDIEDAKGSMLSFNVDTGELMTKAEEQILGQLYEAQTKIAQLKWEWYQANQGKVNNADRYVLSEQELRNVAPDRFPPLPQNYHYVPDSVWQPVQIERE